MDDATRSSSSKGSSPPARGRGHSAADSNTWAGFIPACAGERVGRATGRNRGGVHPRLRGGEAKASCWPCIAWGSSPPARGRDVALDGHILHSGFIPACAGERTAAWRHEGEPGVHPRLRGGELLGRLAGGDLPGSSPPARGRANRAHRIDRGVGFIPACAGERPGACRIRPDHGVHPRLRGGERRTMVPLSADRGSSPPARGREQPPGGMRGNQGFIPACAGERRHGAPAPNVRRVHPRLRGGEFWPAMPASAPWGSSPPARGRAFPKVMKLCYPGFIPACAGERTGRRRAQAVRRVHPRLRGGEAEALINGYLSQGSSPPARGRGDLKQHRSRKVGFIPACAGERQRAAPR